MTPAERKARIQHYRDRRLFIADPGAWAEKQRREKARSAHVRTKPLPELEPWDVRRLWSMIQRGGPDECWPWLGGRSAKGYGRFKVGGRLYLPHRLVHALDKGRFADAPEYHGSVVMHSCDNPCCCNPKHLTHGRHVENVADMIAKGRAHQFGRRTPPRRPA